MMASPSGHQLLVESANDAHVLDHKAYQVWQAKEGVQGMVRLSWVIWPVRMMQLFHSGNARWELWLLTLVGLVHRIVIGRALARDRPLMSCEADDVKGRTDLANVQETARRLDGDLRFWALVQLSFWAMGLLTFVAVCYVFEDDFLRDRTFWGGCVPMLMAQCAVHYLPSRIYHMVVLPVNFAVTLGFHYLMGRLNVTDLLQMVMISALCYYIYTLKDQTEGRLYCANLSADRARRAAEAEHEKAEAWQKAFRGMLNGVFDARCVCDAAGAVWTSTPHLDELLLGRAESLTGSSTLSASRLRGFSLLSFAADAAERSRAEVFLGGLCNDGTMQKFQVSLSRRDGKSTVEVSICAIALPDAAAEEDRQFLLGFQIVSGAEPAECQEIATSDYVMSDLFAGEYRLPPRSVCDVEEVASSVGEGTVMQRMPTRLTAPPVLVQPEAALLRAAAARACAEGDGDCLPPDAVVWVEGQSVPSKVGEVVSGQRILCYDHLTGGLKYSDTVAVESHDASTTEWVAVTLEDGTELKMTSDHPVYPHVAAGAGSTSGAPVKAAELQAQVHRLEVLRLVAVPVREVRVMDNLGTRQGENAPGQREAPNERISLSVRQPERHSIFVASGPGGTGGMAVASASVDVQAASHWLRVKNTFIAGVDDSELASPRMRRADSAPPALREFPDVAEHGRGRLDRRPAPSESTRSVRSLSVGSRETYVSSIASCCTSSAGAAATRILLGAGDAAKRNTMEPDPQYEMHQSAASLKLSSVLEVKRRGLQSIGSLAHASGECCPCLMTSWYHEKKAIGEPCKFGLMCGRCHEEHDPKEVTAFRRQRRREARRLRASAGA